MRIERSRYEPAKSSRLTLAPYSCGTKREAYLLHRFRAVWPRDHLPFNDKTGKARFCTKSPLVIWTALSQNGSGNHEWAKWQKPESAVRCSIVIAFAMEDFLFGLTWQILLSEVVNALGISADVFSDKPSPSRVQQTRTIIVIPLSPTTRCSRSAETNARIDASAAKIGQEW